jgi:hypothetical protein
MKTLMMTLTSLYVLGYVLPKQMNDYYESLSGVSEIYCAAEASGRTIVICDGNTITEDVNLQNGKVLKPDGTIISKDGTHTEMEPGECINKNGKPVKRNGKDKPPKN